MANNDIGLYKFRKELIQVLITAGNEVYISLPYGQYVETLKQMGCKFIETPIDRRGVNPLTDFKLMMFYKHLIQKIGPDLVITYTIKPNIYGGLMSSLKKIPYVVNITGLGTAFQNEGAVKKIIILLYKMALKDNDYTFFENEGNQHVFLKHHMIEEERTVVLNGAGVNLEEYVYKTLPQQGPLRFLFIGRIMKEKGIDEFLGAAQKLHSQYNQVKFDIVGPLEEQYEEKINQFQEKGIIHYYGYQKDVKPFIERAHCLVLPSYHEGMANILLEAAAMGRPLITSNINGCKEAIKDNGYLVNVKDEEDLYRKLESFIKLTDEERQAMGKASREHMEKMFDRRKIVEKSMQYMNSLLASEGE